MAEFERRYQVFVSSTYRDLVDERREVIQALLELDCIPAGMEMFPAADDDQWSLIRRVIDDCDYYVVIVAGRYGSVGTDGLSYTEREYDYALESGKPILGFIHENPDDIRAGDVDVDPTFKERLDEFREKVKSKPVRTFNSPHELGSVVSRSLIRLIKDKPAEGWVRGRNALTPELTEELTNLRAEVTQVELDRVLASQTPIDIEELAQGDDEITVEYTLGGVHSLAPTHTGSRDYTWNEVLMLLGPKMIDEASESTLVERLEADIFGGLSAEGQLPAPYLRVRVDPTSFDQIKIQLRALRIIQKGVRRRAVSDKGTYWVLTEYGDQLLVDLSAIRHDDAEPKRQKPAD